MVDTKKGCMVISLDFEMLWGILDHRNPLDYEQNIKNVPKVAGCLLKIFREHGIHATWGCVGMLTRDDMRAVRIEEPKELPTYREPSLSAYEYFDFLESVNPAYLFAPKLVKKIAATDGQELGSHTYSHFYCNEEGITGSQLKEDLRKSVESLQSFGVTPVSVIFPRNQINENYSRIVSDCGFQNYRGTEDAWFYQIPDTRSGKDILRRGFRLLDHYLPIAGPCCYSWEEIRQRNGLNNIKSSRFFRPYSRQLAIFEPLRVRRIMGQMEYAARHNLVFHIWWHPHNFGKNIKKNLRNLLKLVRHYERLRDAYGFQSLNMGEVGGGICARYDFGKQG